MYDPSSQSEKSIRTSDASLQMTANSPEGSPPLYPGIFAVGGAGSTPLLTCQLEQQIQHDIPIHVPADVIVERIKPASAGPVDRAFQGSIFGHNVVVVNNSNPSLMFLHAQRDTSPHYSPNNARGLMVATSPVPVGIKPADAIIDMKDLPRDEDFMNSHGDPEIDIPMPRRRSRILNFFRLG